MSKQRMPWYQYVCLAVGILGVLFGPMLFTRPYLGGLHWLDFSQTGDIGDTIGGITAPIVGLVSILLLWWTLKEQAAFNTKQESINAEQEKYNDANKVLSLESHIFHMDENLRFGVTDNSKTILCNGISDLKRLYDGTIENAGIATNELEKTVDRVHIIAAAISSLISILDKSKLEIEEKSAAYGMAEMYLSSISDFYGSVSSGRVSIILSSPAEVHANQVDGLKREDVVIRDKCSAYYQAIKSWISSSPSMRERLEIRSVWSTKRE